MRGTKPVPCGIDQRVALRDVADAEQHAADVGVDHDLAVAQRPAQAGLPGAQVVAAERSTCVGRRSTGCSATAAGTGAGRRRRGRSRSAASARRRRNRPARRPRDGRPRCPLVRRASSIGPGTASGSVSGATTPPDVPALQESGPAGVEQAHRQVERMQVEAHARSAPDRRGCGPRSVDALGQRLDQRAGDRPPAATGRSRGSAG